MAQFSSPLDKLIVLLQQRLSSEDAQIIADDYGERSRHDEENSMQKKGLYERLIDKAGDAHEVRLLVLHAMYHKDVMGLLHLIFEYRPDLQQPVQALGFERTSLIRAYLVALLKEVSSVKARIAGPLVLQYRVREPADRWLEVSLNTILEEHARVLLRGASATERTMTLQRLIKHFAADWQAARATAPFPVFADMRRWFNVKMSLLQLLRDQMSWLGIPQLAEQLPELLREGRVVLLLDGLDELPYSKRSGTTGLRDDLRIHSIATLTQEKTWNNTLWVLSCQVRDFLIGPQWHDLYVGDPASKDVAIIEDTPIHLLKAHIEQALEREVGVGHMAEVVEVQIRLGYLALNMTYPELEQERRGFLAAEHKGVEKKLAAAWLFSLREIRSNNQEKYSEPEASPQELQQANRLLHVAEAAGLLIKSGENVLFAHQNIQYYFIISYCLTQSLDDPHFQVRIGMPEFHAIWQLWREFDPALVGKLLELLKRSDNSNQRNFVAYVLRWLDDNLTVEPLIQALDDEDAYVRSNAAMALGNLVDNRAVEPLIALLKNDVSPWVRECAARALGKIEDERRIEPLLEALSDSFVRRTIASVLGGIRDQRVIEPLVALLADYNGLAFMPAKEALVAYGKAAVPALMIALIDPKVGEQYQKKNYSSLGRGEASYNAAEVLGEIGDIRPLPLLLWLIEHDSEVGESHNGSKVRHVAEEAVKKIRKRYQTAAPLVVALRSEDNTMRTAVAFALGLLDDRRAVEPLIAALQDKNGYIRWGAADLLGRLGDTRAIVSLIMALGDEASSGSSADALHKFGELALPPLIATLSNENSNVRGNAANILGKLRNKKAVEPLIAALADENSWVRRRVISALQMLCDSRALEPLLALASDPVREVRRCIPSAIYAIDPERAVDVLIVALKDRDKEVRYWTASDLYRMGNSRAVEALIVALKDEYRLVREYAGYALTKYGDERVVEPLIDNLEDEFTLAARAAVSALGAIGDIRAIEPLVAKLSNEDQDYCVNVVEALVPFGTQVIAPLLASLKQEDPSASFYIYSTYYWDWDMRTQDIQRAHLHYYAADILGKVGDTRALPPLVWMAQNDMNETKYGYTRVKDVAAQAVKSIMQRYQDTIQSVVSLDDQDATVRIGVAFALGLQGEKQATEILLSAMTDQDKRIRWGVVHLLGELGEHQAIPTLISAFEDEDSDVRNCAVAALTRIGPPAVEGLIAVCKEVHEWPVYTWIAYTLGQIGKTSLQLVLSILQDGDSNVRYWAARASAYTEKQEAVEPLRIILKDVDVTVRLSAASALVLLGDVGMREFVLAGLKDEDADVRFAAIENLLMIPDAQATELLVTLLEDESHVLRDMAVIALGEMGDSRALPALERLAGIRHSGWDTWEIFPGSRQQCIAESTGDEAEELWELTEEVASGSAQENKPEDQGKTLVEISGDAELSVGDDADLFAWALPALDNPKDPVEPIESGVREVQVDDELRELVRNSIESIKKRQK